MLSVSQAYDVLGVTRNCSFTELKAAFRSRVMHILNPDVRKDAGDSDVMIRRVIKAYEMLSMNSQFQTSERVSSIFMCTKSTSCLLILINWYYMRNFSSILSLPYSSSAEADYLYSLITKAKFENNRYQKPRREPMVTIYNVDMF
ncbi:hypothetical protein IFM89_037529 [Coptis chinensis]|uniref:J domain-containing protein n=1 Tax=Coptis chinensis TaxID=261450 RepID=A0A835M1T5_9MAGN|nr:hypothetical protein IFM89_037529 [Coptis chinensis]